MIKHDSLRWRIAVAGHELRTPLPEEGQLEGRHSPSNCCGVSVKGVTIPPLTVDPAKRPPSRPRLRAGHRRG